MVLVPVAALVISMAGCSSLGGATATPSPTPTGGTTPLVTLSAPPTVEVGGPLALVIDSSGHDGEQAKLYAFPTAYDQPPDCADTTIAPSPVTLIGGPQQITLNAIQTGQDVYWVVSGDGFASQCGDAKTRALMPLTPDLLFFSTNGMVTRSPEWGSVTIENDEIGVNGSGWQYQVTVRYSTAGQPITMAATWVGPFATAPDANATPCPMAPVASTDQLTFDTRGYVETSKGFTEPHATASVPDAPGIYRLVMSAEETPYSAALEPTCETATLVTIR